MKSPEKYVREYSQLNMCEVIRDMLILFITGVALVCFLRSDSSPQTRANQLEQLQNVTMENKLLLEGYTASVDLLKNMTDKYNILTAKYNALEINYQECMAQTCEPVVIHKLPNEAIALLVSVFSFCGISVFVCHVLHQREIKQLKKRRKKKSTPSSSE